MQAHTHTANTVQSKLKIHFWLHFDPKEWGEYRKNTRIPMNHFGTTQYLCKSRNHNFGYKY